MADFAICKIPDCGKRHFGHGWCQAHYSRWRKYGDPLAGRTPIGEPQQFFREVVLPFNGHQCLIWPYSKGPKGYGTVYYNGRKQRVNRLVCETLCGPPPSSRHEAAHSCGQAHKGCVNPKHLRWATHEENEADKVTHGTVAKGSRHGLTTLTEQQVLEICALRGQMSQRRIAIQFGTSKVTVYNIQHRNTWSWLTS